MENLELTDSNGIKLKNGDKTYVSVRGYFGQICPVVNNKIDFTNIKSFSRPDYMQLNIKKISNE